jgi:hypothetical protein
MMSILYLNHVLISSLQKVGPQPSPTISSPFQPFFRHESPWIAMAFHAICTLSMEDRWLARGAASATSASSEMPLKRPEGRELRRREARETRSSSRSPTM